jgi:hypothetical protein
MSQDVRVLMQSSNLPPILNDLQLAFSKALDGDTRGTFWNDLWAFDPSPETPDKHSSSPMLAKSKQVPLPTWIDEGITSGALRGIATKPAKRCPPVCLSQESLTFRGMQFSIAANSLGNSYVVFKRKMESDSADNHWSAGSIQMIFHLQIEEETHGPFFTIKPYLPLNAADAQFDPYRKFFFAAGQLVYEECGDLVVCILDEVLCHFAHTPYTGRSQEISKPCIHVLPLDRVCTLCCFVIHLHTDWHHRNKVECQTLPKNENADYIVLKAKVEKRDGDRVLIYADTLMIESFSKEFLTQISYLFVKFRTRPGLRKHQRVCPIFATRRGTRFT